MCKRRSACSSTEAHQMTILPAQTYLDSTQKWTKHYGDTEPLVLQRFIQHDGVIVKIYVADGQINVSTRPSFINVTPQTSKIKRRSIQEHALTICLYRRHPFRQPNATKAIWKDSTDFILSTGCPQCYYVFRYKKCANTERSSFGSQTTATDCHNFTRSLGKMESEMHMGLCVLTLDRFDL
jgi:hypothetical protein